MESAMLDGLVKMATRLSLAGKAAHLNNLTDLQKAGRERYRKHNKLGEFAGDKAGEWTEDVINLGDVTVNQQMPKSSSSGVLKGLAVAAALAASGAGGAGLMAWLLRPAAATAVNDTDTDTVFSLDLPDGEVADGT